jgi:hypothetical protein
MYLRVHGYVLVVPQIVAQILSNDVTYPRRKFKKTYVCLLSKNKVFQEIDETAVSSRLATG